MIDPPDGGNAITPHAGGNAIDPHAGVLAIDTHVDIPWPPGPSPFEDGPRNVDFPKLRKGRVGAVCFVAYIPQGQRDAAGYAKAVTRTREMLFEINAMGTQDDKGGVVAPSADGIEAAFKAGRIAVIPAIENGYGIGLDLANLDEFAGLGVRYVTLTHNGHNQIGDAAVPLRVLGDEDTRYGGLSDFGQEVVARMNQLGVLVDISHSAKSTMLQAVERSKVPVLATHSCARTLCEHKRNLDDEQLDALKTSGGLVQVTMVSSFLKSKARTEQVSVKDIVDHIDYITNRIGIDHVGFGSDFDGGGGVRDFITAAQAPRLTAELHSRGYGHEEIAKIWGGNVLRLLRRAEAYAAMQNKPFVAPQHMP